MKNMKNMKDSKNSNKLITTAVLVLTLGACSVGQDYQRVDLNLPTGFKYANPANVDLSSKWWTKFNDEKLNALIEELVQNNISLISAKARFEGAKAVVKNAYSGFWPNFDLSASKKNSNAGQSTRLDLNVKWQLDLWGKARRQLESDKASLEASFYDLNAIKLTLIGELIKNYWQVGMLDAQQRLLQQTVTTYNRAHQITQNKYKAGIAPKSDVTQALMQVKNAQIGVLELQYNRVKYENAIALLLGKTPSTFALAEVKNLPDALDIVSSIPSKLLERRPDVASSEQKVIAANAQIGVVTAAYFPDFSFSAGAGFAGSSSSNLFNTDNKNWSIGPAINFGLLDFGARRANVMRAKANHSQAVADYKLTVLTAIGEVEDALANAYFLRQQNVIYIEALNASKESLQLMTNQYQAGKVDYQNVVNLQTSALNQERSLITLKTNRLINNIALIIALGGDI